MCLVVDACAFASVFNREAADHGEYRPVLDWLILGNGKLVYGGTKYRSELRELGKFIKFLSELKRAGKVIEVDDGEIDKIQKGIERRISAKKFNDAHLSAIVIASRCALICTNEKAALGYIKNRDLYPAGIARPKIYTKYKNRSLLCDQNIAKICHPKIKASKALRDFFER